MSMRLLLLLSVARGQQRTASVHEVQPDLRDTVHAVWPNGPTYNGKLSGSASSSWPTFQAGVPTRAGSLCAQRDDTRYTGYDDSGRYCEAASTALDDNAQLLLHSGRLGIVVDAGGLQAVAGSHSRNLFPKLGALNATMTAREAYDALSASETNFTLDVTCGTSTIRYVLGTIGGTSVQVGLVRQGHTVTQLTLSGLEFQSESSGGVFGPCETFVAARQPDASFAAAVGAGRRLDHATNHHCNQNHGGASHPCPSADFPSCVGFVQGSGWGSCYSVCTAAGAHPNLWVELSVWGDSIALEIAWDADFTLGAGCTGAITAAVGAFSTTTALPAGSGRRLEAFHSAKGGAARGVTEDLPAAPILEGPADPRQPSTTDGAPNVQIGGADDVHYFPNLSGEQASARHHASAHRALRATAAERRELQSTAAQRRASLRLTIADDGSLTSAQTSSHPIQVTSSAGRWVLTRTPTDDVVVEVPTSVGTCGYNTACAAHSLKLVGIVATNPHPTAFQTLRLSFSRNFEVRDGNLPQSTAGAEITGLSTQLWQTSSLQPTGIPMQISKNWHTGNADAYWAGFDGYWWTANSLLRLPPNSMIDLSLALNYEQYGGLPAFSHAQLSIVGYSDKWLWEQSALGSGGENLCMDPLGTHTRAFLTDIRPKLFDGKWKENVGGGDFVQLFGADGKLQYMKEMDPQLHASGPCLSKAEYTSVTLDGSVRSRVAISGGRTDDLVRVFIDLQLTVEQDITFSRLVFFQLTSETYSYRADHERVVWGGAGVPTTSLVQACSASSGLNLRSSAKLYAADGAGIPFREPMGGSAPWWVAFENNTDSVTGDMVVGDKGVVIRSYSARLGGVDRPSPSFSVLCDKIELGTPAGLLTLSAGDSVNMSLELLVLPRSGEEYDRALRNTWNARGGGAQRLTLRDQLHGMSSSEQVRAQALGGELTVTATRNARVDGHYPVRVFATAGADVMFQVRSKNATEVAVAMGDWCVGNHKQDNIWCCAASCGACGGASCASDAGGEAQSCCTSSMQAPCLTESQHTCVNPSHASMAPLHAAPLGHVPIVISGLATHDVPTGHGLWLRPLGASSFTRLTQGTGNGFWQTNFDRASGTYEVVYNVQLEHASTAVAFGSDPNTWSPSPSPPPQPSSPPSPQPPSSSPCPPPPPAPPPSAHLPPASTTSPPSALPSPPALSPSPPSTRPFYPPGGPGAASLTIHKAAVTMTAQGDVADFTLARRQAVAQVVADTAQVDVSTVTITVSSASVVIRAEIEAATATAASALQSNVAAVFSSPQATTIALAAADIVVTSNPTVEAITENVVAYPPPPPSPPVDVPSTTGDESPDAAIWIAVSAAAAGALVLAIGGVRFRTSKGRRSKAFRASTASAAGLDANAAKPHPQVRPQVQVQAPVPVPADVRLYSQQL